jgi:hypothetical protein
VTTGPVLHDDILDLLTEFDRAGVEFLVVGAHALAAHGIPRATADFDVLVRPTLQNAQRVVSALRSFGAPLHAHGVVAADFAVPGKVYQLGLPPRRIDLLTRLSGVSWDEAAHDPLIARVGTAVFPVLSREALLRNKRATGRSKDLLDVKLLESHSGPARRDPAD